MKAKTASQKRKSIPWINSKAISLSQSGDWTPEYSLSLRATNLRNMMLCNNGDRGAAWLECGKHYEPWDAVYFIRMGQTDAFKIGYSGDAIGRMADLQVSSPVGLSLRAFVSFLTPDALGDAEYEAHKLAAKFGKRLRGEWFELSDLAVMRVAKELAGKFEDDVFGILI